MLVPSGIHAKYPIPRNAESPPQSPLFSHFHLKNHPLDSTKTHFFGHVVAPAPRFTALHPHNDSSANSRRTPLASRDS